MAADVKRWCESCTPVLGMRAPLQPIVTTRPWELVTVDIVEYTKSDNGNQYALVLVDHFTKYLELYPIPDAKALTAARKIFGEWVPRYEAPEKLHSDQGTNLNAKLIQEVCSLLQMWKTRTIPFHPQSDGATERVIRTVNAMLAKCVAENEDWDVKLGPVTMAYNSAVHESIGFTPYFLEHGREMRLPEDLMGGPSPGHSFPVMKYGQELKKGSDSAFTMARDSLDASHRRQKAGYDKWARKNPYKVGDKVWWFDKKSRKGRCMRLNLPWSYLWTVIKQLIKVVYRIKYCGRTPVRVQRRVVHHNQLKRCADMEGNPQIEDCSVRDKGETSGTPPGHETVVHQNTAPPTPLLYPLHTSNGPLLDAEPALPDADPVLPNAQPGVDVAPDPPFIGEPAHNRGEQVVHDEAPLAKTVRTCRISKPCRDPNFVYD